MLLAIGLSLAAANTTNASNPGAKTSTRNMGAMMMRSSVMTVRAAPGAVSNNSIVICNTETIPGRDIVEFYGVVTGNTVRAKHVGRDIMAGLKNIVGGELTGYTELLQDSRKEATDRMVEQAASMGANAVVNVRFATSSIAQGAAELFAYGTAVRVA